MNYFDCHADTLTEIPNACNLWRTTGNLDLERVCAFTEHYVQVFALWRDAKKTTDIGIEAEFMETYQRLRRFLSDQKNKISLCNNGNEMKNALRHNRAAAFLAIEDISIMGQYVHQIRNLGFTIAMLTWNYENRYAAGAAYNQEKGLTACGKELVKDLAAQGIVLDLSHLSDTGVEELLTMTNQPIIASHSNARTICDNPRNLTDGQIREIIRRKGLIGMNFYAPFIGLGETVELHDLFSHMEHVLALGGEDVLAIGSDFDGCRNQFPTGITGAESIPYLKREMKRAGFDTITIEKILFENAYHFFSKI